MPFTGIVEILATRGGERNGDIITGGKWQAPHGSKRIHLQSICEIASGDLMPEIFGKNLRRVIFNFGRADGSEVFLESCNMCREGRGLRTGTGGKNTRFRKQ